MKGYTLTAVTRGQIDQETQTGILNTMKLHTEFYTDAPVESFKVLYDSINDETSFIINFESPESLELGLLLLTESIEIDLSTIAQVTCEEKRIVA